MVLGIGLLGTLLAGLALSGHLFQTASALPDDLQLQIQRDLESDRPRVGNRHNNKLLPLPSSADRDTILPNGAGEGWPTLLGPMHNCRSSETDLNWQWPEQGPFEKWRIPIGTGYSSPVVLGDSLILLHRKENHELLDCIDAETGRLRWSCAWPTNYKCPYNYSSGPYCTPVLENDRVYAMGAEGRLVCVDLNDGTELWHRDLHQEYKVTDNAWPAAASPLIDGDRLILNLGARATEAGVIAIDKKSGNTLWTMTQNGASCSTPRAATIHDQRFAFVWTAENLVALNPENGHVHWQIRFFANNKEAIHGTSPLIVDDMVFISGYQIGNLCVRILPDGSYQELWRDERKSLDSQYNSLIYQDGCVYGFSTTRRGLRCLDLKTGRLNWKWRGKIKNGNLIAVDNRFLLFGEKGHLASLTVDKQGAKLLSITKNRILSPPAFSYPALHKGLLYLRNEKELLCIDLRREKTN